MRMNLFLRGISHRQNGWILVSFFIVVAFSCRAQTVDRIVKGAYDEVKNSTAYDSKMLSTYIAPTYKGGEDTGTSVYPWGDVNPKKGICTDLIVRALRNAGIDLQRDVHRDVSANKRTYGVKVPDKFIDHRRVWILKTFFERHWASLTTRLDNPRDWQPGDIVIWDIGSRDHFHIGIVGHKKRGDGFPYVIHNMCYVPLVFTGKTTEQDVLEGPRVCSIVVSKWQIIGHYRFK
jgi:uncharacterized protein YijF (DUF1287 family)